ncbi:SAM-dependent methyltransferase [Pseudonocardia sichuanensis]
MSDASELSPFDPDVPNPARMYDCFLGGSHNFAADRAAAGQVEENVPWVVAAVRANRFFLGRAVRFCLAEGVDQFLDLGSGIPTVGHVHEVAQRVSPAARVAYVDVEPVTVASAAALLDGDAHTTITAADMRDPDAVFDAPGVRDLLDLSRPVALLTVSVLHYLSDEDDPVALVERYRRRLVPGSLHVLSHVTGDHDPDPIAAAERVYRGTATPLTFRPRRRIEEMLAGTELVEPGLVDASQWRPQDPADAQHRGFWAGVGRIGQYRRV